MEMTKLTTAVFLYACQSGIILMVFYALYYCFLRKESCFGFSRYYLLLAPIAALVLPLLSLPKPYFAETTTAFLHLDTYLPEVEVSSAITTTIGASVAATWLLLSIYIIGFIISVCVFLHQLSILRKLKKCSTSTGLWNGINVVTTEAKYPTFSFLGTIFLNTDSIQTEEDKTAILFHESIHIKEHHTIDVMIMSILAAVFWYHPFFKLFLAAIKLNHEYIADARVLTSSAITKEKYQKSLAINSLHPSYLSLGTFFNTSETLRRIKMMNKKPKSIGAAKLTLLLSSAALLCFTFSCESNHVKSPLEKENAWAENQETLNAEENSAGDIFSLVDQQPSFAGMGNAGFMKYIGKNLKYPPRDHENAVEGMVYIQFFIEKDGAVTNVEVLKNTGSEEMAGESLRVVEKSPNWAPGEHDGEPVRVRMVIPISFKLS